MGWTEIFLLVVSASLGLRIWLASRQMRHVFSHRSQVPADFSAHISLQAHEKAADYTTAKVRLGMLTLWWEAAILLGLTLFGGIDFIQGLTTQWFSGIWAGLALIGAIAVVTSLLDLPFSYYRQFALEERFGFNRMTRKLFFSDLAKGSLLGIGVGAPLILAVLALMRDAGQSWWIWAWALWFGFSLIVMWAYPTIIAPLFNKFTPMQDGTAKQRILDLLERCGFNSDGLFVMDGSKRSSHGNAYFSGMGKAKRIVFFDTLLNRLNEDQIEAVLAHELGHFKKKHLRKHLLFSAVFGFALFALLGFLLNAPWFYTDLGVTPDLNNGPEAAALLLFSMVLPWFLFPLKPLVSWLSRKHEFEADEYAAKQSDAQHLISALVKLYEDNAATLTPDRIHSMFYDTHPPAAIRVGRLNQLSKATP